MANPNHSMLSRLGTHYAPTSVLLRFGRWELSVCREAGRRCYRLNRLLDLDNNVVAGKIELLLLRRWRCILKRAR